MSTSKDGVAPGSVLVADVFTGRLLGRPVFRLVAPGRLGDAGVGLPPDVNGRIMVEAKVPVNDVEQVGRLSEAGFAVVDVGVQLDAPASVLRAGGAPVLSSWSVRDARPDDCEPAARVAGETLVTSRFHLDPGIDCRDASELKREWVRNFFRGLRGERLLVAEAGGEVAGFLQVLEHEALGTIDLIAVLPVLQGTGAAAELVRFWLAGSPEIDRVRVGTQISNVRSLRAYERMGFRVRESAYVLHFHGDASLLRSVRV